MARGQTGKIGAPAQWRAVVEHRFGCGIVTILLHKMEAKYVPDLHLKRDLATQAAVQVRFNPFLISTCDSKKVVRN